MSIFQVCIVEYEDSRHLPLYILDLAHRFLAQNLLLVETVRAPVRSIHLGVQSLELPRQPKCLVRYNVIENVQIPTEISASEEQFKTGYNWQLVRFCLWYSKRSCLIDDRQHIQDKFLSRCPKSPSVDITKHMHVISKRTRPLSISTYHLFIC